MGSKLLWTKLLDYSSFSRTGRGSHKLAWPGCHVIVTASKRCASYLLNGQILNYKIELGDSYVSSTHHVNSINEYLICQYKASHHLFFIY